MPSTVTPASADLDGGETLAFIASNTLTFSTDVGVLYNDPALTTLHDGITPVNFVYLKTFNRTLNGKVMVSDGGFADVSVTGVFPDVPSYPLEWDGEKMGVVPSISRSGRRRGRVVSDAEYMRNYKLLFAGRRPSEIAAIEEFYDYHYPDKPFLFENVLLGITGHFVFDSKFKGKGLSRMRGEGEIAIAQVPYP